MDTMPTGPNIAAGRLAQWAWGWLVELAGA